MNKKVFYEKLKNKQYTECIEMLRKEVINILVIKIREKGVIFNYSTTRDLYNISKRYLDDKEIMIAYQLYNFDIANEVEELILDELLQAYKDLTEKI